MSLVVGPEHITILSLSPPLPSLPPLSSAVVCHRKDWAMHYPLQNLEVYSANPLLLNPTHYVGDTGWYSDTG